MCYLSDLKADCLFDMKISIPTPYLSISGPVKGRARTDSTKRALALLVLSEFHNLRPNFISVRTLPKKKYDISTDWWIYVSKI